MKKKISFYGVVTIGICIFTLGTFLAATASAAASTKPGIPNMIGIGSLRIGSAGHLMAATLGELLQEKTGIKVRVVPIDSDTARLSLLRSGDIQISIMPTIHYSMRTGIGDFAKFEWGPQPLQMVWLGPSLTGALTTRTNKEINSLTDIKGKRIALMPTVGSQVLPKAMVAFAGLKDEDVIWVNVSGYMAQFTALMAGAVDVAPIGNIATGKLREMEASPKGIKWLPLPHRNEEGWRRLRQIAFWETKELITEGPGISKDKPLEGAGHFYGFVTTDKVSADLINLLTKTIGDNLDRLYAATDAWRPYTIERALATTGLYIYHQGAVKYFKDKGLWTSEHDQRNQSVIKQQDKLTTAWQNLLDRAIAEKWKDEKVKKEWHKIQEPITGYSPPDWF
jgi:TRAP transporter TAXI family solute receptor